MIRKQVDEAVAVLRPVTNAVAIGSFRREGVCRAAELLRPHLENTRLEAADPKLAAKAHRVMAAVYAAAFVCPWSRGDCIHKLVVGDALTKAARELEAALRLYSQQPEAAQAREIASQLNRGKDPTIEELRRYLKFLTENLGARVSW
jgi:hypothetical protein